MQDESANHKAINLALAKRVEVGLFAQFLADNQDYRLATLAELEMLIAQGKDAVKRLYWLNRQLAYQLASYWRRRSGLPLEDLAQEAMASLGNAIRGFDWAKGNSFASYAWQVIDNNLRFIVGHADHQITISREMSRNASIARYLEDQFRQVNSYSPDIAELAELIGSRPNYLAKAMAARPPVLFDRFPDSIGTCQTPKYDNARLLACGLRRCISQLSTIEAAVICAHYGIDRLAASQNAIAAEFDLTNKQVRDILLRAKQKLRMMLEPQHCSTEPALAIA